MKSINKNQKKYLLSVICLVVGVGIVISFVSILTRPEDPNKKTNLTSQSDITDDHLYQVISDNFKVDADITAPHRENVDVLYAKYMNFDKNDVLLSTLFDGKSPKRAASDHVISYTEGESLKNYLTIEPEYACGGRDAIIQYLSFPTDNFHTKYDDWTYKINVLPNYSTVYKKEGLNFMDRQEAVDYAYSFLQKLNIEVSKEAAEVYAIDYETMQEYQDKLKKEEPDSAVNYYIKDKFTEDDDFYILCFTAMQNKMPISHADYCHKSNRIMLGSNIKIYLSKKGIFRLSLDGVYQIQGVAEASQKTITAQEAVNKTFAVYDSIVTTNTATVDELRFEYAAIPYNSNYTEVKLTPVWTVHLSVMMEGSNFEYYQTMLIDAITGEKIG